MVTSAPIPERCILKAQGITKSFGEKEVLRGVDLEFLPGAITTIIGKSGEGKSVLLKILAGLIEPSQGYVHVNCHPCKLSGGPNLSLLFQHNALFDSMTAFDNVALPLRERTKQPERQISKRIHQLFERLDLGDIGDKYPAELSGGMQKRVALARALVFNPRIVLFDEPTTGLDPLRKNAVFMMISRYQREFGFTAVLVTHDLPDVLFFSDRVLTLREGRIAFDGSPLQLDQSPSAFNEGFIHSRDDLRDELNGLSKRAELSRQLPVLQERQCGLAVITIDGFDALEEELGEVAAHLIQSNLVKNLKDIPGFTSEAYSLNRYSFCIITEKVFAADDPDVLWAFDGFKRFLWGLKTDRCVEFSVKLAILDARSTASSEAVRTEGFAKAIQAFKHRCG